MATEVKHDHIIGIGFFGYLPDCAEYPGTGSILIEEQSDVFFRYGASLSTGEVLIEPECITSGVCESWHGGVSTHSGYNGIDPDASVDLIVRNVFGLIVI